MPDEITLSLGTMPLSKTRAVLLLLENIDLNVELQTDVGSYGLAKATMRHIQRDLDLNFDSNMETALTSIVKEVGTLAFSVDQFDRFKSIFPVSSDDWKDLTERLTLYVEEKLPNLK